MWLLDGKACRWPVKSKVGGYCACLPVTAPVDDPDGAMATLYRQRQGYELRRSAYVDGARKLTTSRQSKTDRSAAPWLVVELGRKRGVERGGLGGDPSAAAGGGDADPGDREGDGDFAQHGEAGVGRRWAASVSAAGPGVDRGCGGAADL
jgi:hypothetical protein